jgi:hypothetical membrane protein
VLATCYVLGALAAGIAYPGALSPLDNWLSDLGSYELNPHGAVFYNTGIIAAGLATVLFFLGLTVRGGAGRPIQWAMLAATRVFGVLGGLVMVLSAVFPMGTPAHSFWSTAIYVLLGTAFAFSVAAMRYSTHFPRWILIFGAVVALEDLAWSVVFNIPVMEWLTVSLFLGYVLVVGDAMRHRRTEPVTSGGSGETGS